jgi:transposase
LKLARLIVEGECPIALAAQRFQVSWPTAKRWRDRYLELGEAGMADRSSRPHRMPRKTPRPVVRKIVHLRWKQRLGQLEIAARLGIAASTVHLVLRRCGISRLSHVDRATGQPVRRYEHPHPGSMIHVDSQVAGQHP